MMLVELHVSALQAREMVAWFASCGWRCFVAESTPTEKGTRGGVAIAVRAHLDVTDVHCSPESGRIAVPSMGDWVAAAVRLKGMSLLLVAMYLDHSVGPVGQNAEKLRQ
eukprot:13451004-Alexandrium_andersonii.AAC.1